MHLVTNLARQYSNKLTGSNLYDIRQCDPTGVIARLINDNSLDIVWQPIVNMLNGSIFAHEALVRGPKDSIYYSPNALLKIARSEDSLVEFEIACVVKALENWADKRHGGQIFINVSSSALTHNYRGKTVGAITSSIKHFGISPEEVIFEITEYEHILDIPDFISIASMLHSAGLRFALDDFGDGCSSLRLWSELAPDFVKIDKYFTQDISTNASKVKTVKALMQMADNFECALIAEGIENAQDLRVLRDLGIQLGQGYFLGRPQPKPLHAVEEEALSIFSGRPISKLPCQPSAPQKITLRESMIIIPPSLTREDSNAEVVKIFADNPGFHALAVVEGGFPVAIIAREELLTQSAKPYFNELFGKKSCMRHANINPRTVELDQDVQDLIGILTSQDQRYQSEGFIYTKNGRYVGMGMGEHLAKLVSESRLEVAKHANPLTSLPGNIPISTHINHLLKRKGNFVVAYADLANFKPFNDFYGFWQGDEVIKLVAATMLRHLDDALDFVGHVGGDDFLLVFQSEDWHARLSKGIDEFNLAVVKLHDEDAIRAGGILAEDRDGTKRFFPMTTLYAGVVHVHNGPYKSASEVSSAAATARHLAKKEGVNIYINDVPARMAQWIS
ncbi:MAG: EAL domain-containing protein [Rhodoferax sp.]|uniref:EAL domain-containing protein n=1 Tax=Rhodoferax sp. TaxID=50421 RepID=UPI0030166D51